MKIKAREIKPGMVIGIDRDDNYGDICLVIATKGLVDVEYTHLNFQEAHYGAFVGTIYGKTKVKVIKGKNRQHVIKKIKDDVFRNLHDINNTIDTLRLIEAMS